MKRVLVTGGCGFIGSHITDALLQRGYEVAVFDNISTGSLDNISGQDVTLYLGDIGSAELERAMAAFKPDFVIHQAAQVSVQHSVLHYDEDAHTNIAGTIRVLDACRRHGVQKIVFASSAAVYGDVECVPVPVTQKEQPTSPYGLSKYTAEQYLRLVHHLHGLPYVILRYSNVYGPRQNVQGEGGVISIFFDKLLNGEQPILFGDGGQTRDFVFVKDVALANVRAIEAPVCGTFHVSTQQELSVLELFQEIRRQCGSTLQPIFTHPRLGDIRRSMLANDETIHHLGWQPSFSLKDGLAETYAYYQAGRTMPQLLSNF